MASALLHMAGISYFRESRPGPDYQGVAFTSSVQFTDPGQVYQNAFGFRILLELDHQVGATAKCNTSTFSPFKLLQSLLRKLGEKIGVVKHLFIPI